MYQEKCLEIYGVIFMTNLKLRELFRESNQELWTSCEFDFTNEGKLNVSFDYIDWENSEFGPLAQENYYKYKKFGIVPEKNMR